MPDRIEIRGLRALGLIGVNPEERERPQPFEVDFDVELDTAKAGATDDLHDTIDYGRRRPGRAGGDTEPHLLLERVAQRIAQVLLGADDRIEATTVTCASCGPPRPGRPGDERRDHHEVPVTRALLALGSNLGDRVRYLPGRGRAPARPRGRLTRVRDRPGRRPGRPGPVPEHGRAAGHRALDAHELLELCHRLEEKASRRRIVRWGPRTLDVDVLWVDGETVDEPDLTVPHPRMQDRPFVLAPLRDVAPDLVPDGWEQRFDHLGVSRLGELDELTPRPRPDREAP